jgi:RNA polymerase sigma-70 factor (ECF subfamily)
MHKAMLPMIAGSTQRFEDRDSAAQFKELALPLLDDVYTLARYLLSSAADDAVQECTAPLWQEVRDTPETALLRELDAATIRRLVAALPTQFREAIVLREINDLSYREIADVIGAPVGTVMSRLARARFMLRAAWKTEEGFPA